MATKVGTPLYLSPEQVKQSPYDYKVDIWGIGCCLYHLAAFEPPFKADNLITLGHKIVNEKPRRISEKYYSNELNTFIFKMLDKNSTMRPTAVEALQSFPKSIKNLYSEYTELSDLSKTKSEAFETTQTCLLNKRDTTS